MSQQHTDPGEGVYEIQISRPYYRTITVRVRVSGQNRAIAAYSDMLSNTTGGIQMGSDDDVLSIVFNPDHPAAPDTYHPNR